MGGGGSEVASEVDAKIVNIFLWLNSVELTSNLIKIYKWCKLIWKIQLTRIVSRFPPLIPCQRANRQ